MLSRSLELARALGIGDFVDTDSVMYFLSHLKSAFAGSLSGTVTTEYRLLCSGELYNPRVLTFDYRKSDVARWLLREQTDHFDLWVCSQPYDTYPQELLLRFRTVLATEGTEAFSLAFVPDDEIARDLAALLTLFCRRLVTVAVKVRQTHAPSDPYDLPVVGASRSSFWRRRPIQAKFGSKGLEALEDLNPPPQALDSLSAEQHLRWLSGSEHAPAALQATRLYALAMELIERHPDLSYQLLISAVETMAGEMLRGYSPSADEILQANAGLVDHVRGCGLDLEKAQSVVLKAQESNPWTSRKFYKFIEENIDDSVWGTDRVFPVPEMYLPKPDDLVAILKLIYRHRNKAVHAGHSFGAVATVGTTTGVSPRAMLELFAEGVRLPPVGWFERVVRCALLSAMGGREAPAPIQQTTPDE